MTRANYKQGFSLVDIIVSIALFSIVILICVGSLLAVVDSNRKDRSMKQAMDNLNVVLENITRNTRLGDKYYCSNSSITINPCDNVGSGSTCAVGQESQDCQYASSGISGGTNFAFRDKNGGVTLYKMISPGGQNCIGKKVTNPTTNPWSMGYPYNGDSDADSTYSCMTDTSNFSLDYFHFYVTGTDPNDATVQPKIVIVIQGHSGVTEKTRTDINLMTSINQRTDHLDENPVILN